MKLNRNLLNSVVGCAIALAVVSTAVAQGAMDGAAKVVRVKGPDRYTTGNNVWQPVKTGDVVRPGTVIQTSTEDGSYVDLVLGDGNAAVPQPVTYRPCLRRRCRFARAPSKTWCASGPTVPWASTN